MVEYKIHIDYYSVCDFMIQLEKSGFNKLNPFEDKNIKTHLLELILLEDDPEIIKVRITQSKPPEKTALVVFSCDYNSLLKYIKESINDYEIKQ